MIEFIIDRLEPSIYYVNKEVGGVRKKNKFLLTFSTINADVGRWVGPRLKHADVIYVWSHG